MAVIQKHDFAELEVVKLARLGIDIILINILLWVFVRTRNSNLTKQDDKRDMISIRGQACFIEEWHASNSVIYQIAIEQEK